jgi:hypothetical protein
MYEDYLDALTQMAKCQDRRDQESPLYRHLRKKIDDLHPQLTEVESDDAYWFSLSLDKPLEGAVYLKGDLSGEEDRDDEDEDRAE